MNWTISYDSVYVKRDVFILSVIVNAQLKRVNIERARLIRLRDVRRNQPSPTQQIDQGAA